MSAPSSSSTMSSSSSSSSSPRPEPRSPPLIRTSSRSPDYVEVHPPNPTRRPPPGGPHNTPTPPPPPDYNTIDPPDIILPNPPPDITEDCSPPWYTWGDEDNINPPVPLFFSAIFTENESELRRLIATDPSIVNRRDQKDRTPLYCAVSAYKRNIGVVRLLLESGAEVNEWSTEFLEPRKSHRSIWFHHDYAQEKTLRTPLMAACQRNHLPIVRLLLAPPYGADSKLVAPDGQHALRLASSAGGREIVQLLPSLRAGGWKRLKYRSRPHIETIKVAGKQMYKVGKFFLWRIPRFFLWTIPKHSAICLWEFLKSIGRCLWKGTKTLGVWISETPGKAKRFARWLPGATARGISVFIDGAKRAPGALGRFLAALWRELWKFLSVTLPKSVADTVKVLWKIVKFLWEVLTVHIPKATVATVKCLWAVFSAIVKWVWNIITVRVPKVTVMVFEALIAAAVKMGEYSVNVLATIASLLHTCYSFVVRQCTWKNVVEGVKRTLGFFFIDVPVVVWKSAEATYKLCYKMFKGLFGCIGWFIWKLAECLVLVALWFPSMGGKILVSCGKIIGGAWKEFRVLIDPKAEV